jgi:transcriptional regulator with XRE-family HTH domain
MNFDNVREWLTRKLQVVDDAGVAAGGTSFADLQRQAASRMVTPATLVEVPTEIGRVVRYVRESHSWSRHELAERATVDEAEVEAIETSRELDIPPRTLVQLADTCGFSRRKFQELAQHFVPYQNGFGALGSLSFAAKSENVAEISRDQFEAVRALVAVLSEKGSGEE